MNAFGAVPRIPPVPELTSDPIVNLARYVRSIEYLTVEHRQGFLDLLMVADLTVTMTTARHDALLRRVMMPPMTWLDWVPRWRKPGVAR